MINAGEMFDQAIATLVAAQSPLSKEYGLLSNPGWIVAIVVLATFSFFAVGGLISIHGTISRPAVYFLHHGAAVAYTSAVALGALFQASLLSLPPPFSDWRASAGLSGQHAVLAAQASPVVARLFFVMFAIRCVEILDVWIGLFCAHGHDRDRLAFYRHSAELAVFWILSYYGPGGPAIWFLVFAGLSSAVSHAVSAGVACGLITDRRLHISASLASSALSVAHAMFTAGYANQSLCPRWVLFTASAHNSLVAILMFERLVSLTFAPPKDKSD